MSKIDEAEWYSRRGWERIGLEDLRRDGYFSHPNPAIVSWVIDAAKRERMEVSKMRIWYPHGASAEYRIDLERPTGWEKIGLEDLDRDGYFSHPNPAIVSQVATAARREGLKVSKIRIWYPHGPAGEYRIDLETPQRDPW